MSAERLVHALDLARRCDGSRPIEQCWIGHDAATALAAHIRALGAAEVLVTADENTRAATDDCVVRALRDAGVRCREKIHGAGPLDASDALGDETAAAAEGADAVVAVGAGTLCDLAKYAGDRLGLPAVLYATAASMNGYTSGITAIKVRGLKRTVPCRPAHAVFANPETVAAAPQRMAAAGLADFLSKCSASADWAAAHFLRDEYYDPNALQFYDGLVDRAVEVAPRVGQGDPEAVAFLLEALLLSGLSMLAAGSSSPASGGEHLISHYIDMKSSLYGAPHDLHGAQVGVATVHCLELWRRVTTLDPAQIDPDAIARAQPDDAIVRGWIDADWGAVADEVWAQWQRKARSRDTLRDEAARVQRELADLRARVQADLLPPEVVAQAIRDAGGPDRPEQLDAPLDTYADACARARFIRDRFTVLDLAAGLGIATAREHQPRRSR